MRKLLVLKLKNGNTISQYRTDGVYPDDPLDEKQIAQIRILWKMQELDLANFQVAAAAYCDAALLDIDGTDPDADISIQDGVVVNARQNG